MAATNMMLSNSQYKFLDDLDVGRRIKKSVSRELFESMSTNVLECRKIKEAQEKTCMKNSQGKKVVHVRTVTTMECCPPQQKQKITAMGCGCMGSTEGCITVIVAGDWKETSESC
jgi:hypothetical protein